MALTYWWWEPYYRSQPWTTVRSYLDSYSYEGEAALMNLTLVGVPWFEDNLRDRFEAVCPEQGVEPLFFFARSESAYGVLRRYHVQCSFRPVAGPVARGVDSGFGGSAGMQVGGWWALAVIAGIAAALAVGFVYLVQSDRVEIFLKKLETTVEQATEVITTPAEVIIKEAGEALADFTKRVGESIKNLAWGAATGAFPIVLIGAGVLVLAIWAMGRPQVREYSREVVYPAVKTAAMMAATKGVVK
ncbi:MAG: hypothetical protein ABIH46_12865 [Chloroflexota bacterium]